MLIYTCIYMQKESQRHNGKGRAKTSLEKYTSHFIVRVQKGLLKVLLWEGVGDRTELQYIDPSLLAISVVSFSFSRAAQPEARGLIFLLSAGFLYHILLETSLDPNSIGGPEGHIGLVWLSLPHLVSNSNCLTSCLDRVI